MSAKDSFDLDGFLPYLLNQAAESAGQAFARIYKEKHGISRTEWRVLAHLGFEATLTGAEIAKRAAVDRTKVSRAVFALEKRGWLSRARDAGDRRQENLSLTESGVTAYKGLAKDALAHQRALTQRLGLQKTRALMDALATLRG